MIYELAKELEDAGFPCERLEHIEEEDGFMQRNCPTLPELIEACGKRFYKLVYPNSRSYPTWRAFSYSPFGAKSIETAFYTTPEEAVARLWLALNKKQP